MRAIDSDRKRRGLTPLPQKDLLRHTERLDAILLAVRDYVFDQLQDGIRLAVLSNKDAVTKAVCTLLRRARRRGIDDLIRIIKPSLTGGRGMVLHPQGWCFNELFCGTKPSVARALAGTMVSVPGADGRVLNVPVFVRMKLEDGWYLYPRGLRERSFGPASVSPRSS